MSCFDSPIAEYHEMSRKFSHWHEIGSFLQFHCLTINEEALVVDDLVGVEGAILLLAFRCRSIPNDYQ